jgi:hypothetical protein
LFASARACADPRGALRSGRVSPLPGDGLRARDAGWSARFLRRIPALVPLPQVRSLHSSGTRD